MTYKELHDAIKEINDKRKVYFWTVEIKTAHFSSGESESWIRYWDDSSDFKDKSATNVLNMVKALSLNEYDFDMVDVGSVTLCDAKTDKK